MSVGFVYKSCGDGCIVKRECDVQEMNIFTGRVKSKFDGGVDVIHGHL